MQMKKTAHKLGTALLAIGVMMLFVGIILLLLVDSPVMPILLGGSIPVNTAGILLLRR